jgi:hypothetical protein
MKFGKEYSKYIIKIKEIDNRIVYVDYKNLKKLIKNIIENYSDIITYNSNIIYNTDDECCICLDNKNLMKTFCCHNYIHYTCFIDSMMNCSQSCPYCRCNLKDSIKYKNKLEEYDACIISLLSVIHIYLYDIERYCKNNSIKDYDTLVKYKQLNYIAIIKICKKINKKLNIDCKKYFINYIQNHTSLCNIPTELLTKNNKKKRNIISKMLNVSYK